MNSMNNGVRLHYKISGKTDAPAVVLSHSLASSMIMWRPQLKALEDSFQVLRYDLRGHGSSAVPEGPYTLEMLADDLAALLDELEIDKVHFVGLSIGGMIGQGFALKHQHRLSSLVLCDTASHTPPEAQPILKKRIKTAEREGMSSQVDETMARWFSQDFLESGRPEVGLIRQQILATSVTGYAGCLEAIRGLDYYQDLPDIEVPTLVIVGEDDPGTPVAASAAISERIANSKLVILPHAQHLSNIEQQGAFNEALRGFLETLEVRN